MQLGDDDEVQKVDSTYLGPPGKYIGRLRYRVIGLFLVIAVVSLYLVDKVFGLSFFPVVWCLIGSAFAADWASDKLSSDRPLTTTFTAATRELVTPRKDETVVRVVGPNLQTLPHLRHATTIERPSRREL